MGVEVHAAALDGTGLMRTLRLPGGELGRSADERPFVTLSCGPAASDDLRLAVEEAG